MKYIKQIAPIACAVAALAPFLHAEDPEPQARNVVFIMADDLGIGEVGAYGQKKIKTPNIDRLAAEGIRFTQHYSGAPVCAPARCVLMTGHHSGRAEIRGNRQAARSFPEFDEGQHPISADSLTMAKVFQEAGFATGAYGKWGLGPHGSTGDPHRQGFDHFFGYNCQAVAHSFYPPYLWNDGEKIMINENPIPGHAQQPTGEVRMEDWIGETYAPDLMIREAVAFIERYQDQRFFLYLPFIEPHVSIHPPIEKVEAFPDWWDVRPYRGESAYVPHPRPRAGYAAMISDLDNHVGAVLEALEAAGILDETLIVFTSDNGPTHPGRGDSHFHIGGADPEYFNSNLDFRGWKGSVYEGGLRVPTIVRWHGQVDPGGVTSFPSYFPDWFPTLTRATGVGTPEDLDGIDIMPALTGAEHATERNPMIWVYPEYGGQIAVRLGDYKVLRREIRTPGGPDPWEVYHIPNDPQELVNLADEKSDLIDEAIELLRRQWTESELFPMDQDKALAR